MNRNVWKVALCIVAVATGIYFASSSVNNSLEQDARRARLLPSSAIEIAQPIPSSNSTHIERNAIEGSISEKHLRSVKSISPVHSNPDVLQTPFFGNPSAYKSRAMAGDERAALAIANALSTCLPSSAIEQMKSMLVATGQTDQVATLPQCSNIPGDIARDKMYWLDLAAKSGGFKAMLEYGLSAALEVDQNRTLNVDDSARASTLRQRAIDYLQQAAQGGVAEAYPILMRYFDTGLVADKNTTLAYAYALAYSQLGGPNAAALEAYYAAKVNTAESAQAKAQAALLVRSCCNAG